MSRPSLIAALFRPLLRSGPVSVEDLARPNSTSEALHEVSCLHQFVEVVRVHATNLMWLRRKVMHSGPAGYARFESTLNGVATQVVRPIKQAGVEQGSCFSQSGAGQDLEVPTVHEVPSPLPECRQYRLVCCDGQALWREPQQACAELLTR